MLFINFKIYQQTFGQGAVNLAKSCKKIADKTGVKIIPVVSPFDLRQVKEICDQVWVQHVDIHFQGPHTGYITPLAAAAAGADGTLLNHSEHKISPGQIHQIISNFEHLNIEYSNFKFCLCFKTKGQVENWLKSIDPKPDFVAYEPPELIGGDISVSQAQPEVVARIKNLLPDYRLIIGAGVKSGKDVSKAIDLGAEGVLVSSGVVTADNPEKALLNLAKGF